MELACSTRHRSPSKRSAKRFVELAATAVCLLASTLTCSFEERSLAVHEVNSSMVLFEVRLPVFPGS